MRIIRLLTRILPFLALGVPAALAQNYSLNSSSYTETFNGMASTTLPTGWKVGGATTVGATATTLNGSSGGNSYKFVSGSDSAIGVLNSGGYGSPKTIEFTFTNNTGSAITAINLGWNYEKYRSGSRSWSWGFASSAGTVGGTPGQTYAADSGNTTVTFNPAGSIAKTTSITGLNLAAGASMTFTWTLTGAGGSSNGQALAIDDFTLSATLAQAGNNSKIWVGGTAPTAANQTTSTAVTSFGRVMQGTSQSTGVTLNKSGSDAAVVDISVTGNATSSSTGNDVNAPASVNAGINTSTTGAKSGTVVVDNQATTSAGASQGSSNGNASISVSGTVVANRDIVVNSSGTSAANPVDLGKTFVDAETASSNVSLNGGALDDNNGTRVTISGSATNGSVTATYTAGGDNTFDSAGESKNVAVKGIFGTSGANSTGTLNAKDLLGNGELSGVGATVDQTVNIHYKADVYQRALLTADTGTVLGNGSEATISNADTTDGGQRAAAEIITKTVSGTGWSVSGLGVGTVISQSGSATGIASFDETGKLNGTHHGTLVLGLEHADQTIQGASAGDLGTRSWNLSFTVSGVVASTGMAAVTSGKSYAGFGLTNGEGHGTKATLLKGTSSSDTELVISFSTNDPGAANDALRISDVVGLSGSGNDVIVMSLSYDPSNIALGVSEADLQLGWFEEGQWVAASAGNIVNNANPDQQGYVGSFEQFQLEYGTDLGNYIGAFGVDTATNEVWAVINHNSDFAVIAVPEPGTFALLATAGVVTMVFRRRRSA